MVTIEVDDKLKFSMPRSQIGHEVIACIVPFFSYCACASKQEFVLSDKSLERSRVCETWWKHLFTKERFKVFLVCLLIGKNGFERCLISDNDKTVYNKKIEVFRKLKCVFWGKGQSCFVECSGNERVWFFVDQVLSSFLKANMMESPTMNLAT